MDNELPTSALASIDEVFPVESEVVSQAEIATIDAAVRQIQENDKFDEGLTRQVFIDSMGEEAGNEAYERFKEGLIKSMMKAYPAPVKKKRDGHEVAHINAEISRRRAAKKAAAKSRKKNRR